MGGRAPSYHDGFRPGRDEDEAMTPAFTPDQERDLIAALMVERDLPDLSLPPRPAWMARGECRFHPEIDFFGKPWRLAAAQAVCVTCPVRDECLAYAMEWEEPDGVWGGLTPSQRRALRPKRGRGRPRKDAKRTRTFEAVMRTSKSNSPVPTVSSQPAR
jgi:WhiB family transcriptional regulator, redox-sensing transcriptional regulator